MSASCAASKTNSAALNEHNALHKTDHYNFILVCVHLKRLQETWNMNDLRDVTAV